jgi:16S rRNA (guanine527-N7)-methyltransferase
VVPVRETRLSGLREPLPTDVTGLPPLPAAYDDALDQALGELDLSLGHDARQKVADHVRLMLAWGEAMNLTAIRDPADVARLHVADSLSAVPVLTARSVTGLIDLGSGAGFPGLPLAIALGCEALLVESVGKKARFLEAAVAATGVGGRVRVAAMRAEALAADRAHRERWPAVTARAVADLAELVEVAFPLLRRRGILVAWKRGDLAAEHAPARRAVDALGGGRIDVEDVAVTSLRGHRLVIVTKLGTTPPGYPRDPAARRRRPW